MSYSGLQARMRAINAAMLSHEAVADGLRTPAGHRVPPPQTDAARPRPTAAFLMFTSRLRCMHVGGFGCR